MKAILAFQGKEIKPIHNIAKLAELAGILHELDMATFIFVDKLSNYYLNARYKETIIDLAIVTSAVNAKNSLAINQDIFHRAMLYNLDLEPICFSPEQFEQEYLPIVRDIKREGVEITASGKSNSHTLTHTPARFSKSQRTSMSKGRRVRV